MKKIATLVFALLLAGSLSFAQTGGDKKTTDTSASADKGDSGKKDEKGKKGKKGKKGDKSKKGSADTTPPPK